MIDFAKYDLDNDDIEFLLEIEDACINGQNEIVLQYKEASFVLEPRGEEIEIYAYGEVLGVYKSFDEALMCHKINGKLLIEIVKDLKFGD